jgi:autotransporter-associated beta strand protein
MSQTRHVNRFRIAAMIGCLVLAAFATSPAHAATRTWSVTTGTGVWQTGASWLDASAPANDTTTDTAYFSSGNGTQMVQLNANASIAGLTFAQTGSTQLASSSATVRTLTIGSSGITVNAGAGAVLFASTVSPQISGNQQWVNNSSSLLRFSGTVQTATAGAQTLTIGGSGTTSFDRIADGVGTLSIVKTGAGTLTTAQTSGAPWTFTGSITVNEGLYQSNGAQVPNVDLILNASGTANLPNNTASIRSLAGSGRLTGAQVSVTGGSNTTFSGTFSAGITNSGSGRLTLTGSNSGGAGLSVTGSNAEIVIGSPSALWYSSVSNSGIVTLDSGTLSFGTGVTSGTSNRLFGTGGVLNLTNADGNAVSYSTGNPNAVATYTGTSAASIIGLGSLRKHGANTQILTGSNSYTGGTFVDSGILQIGNGGTTGSIVGNATMANSTTLIFNRSDATSFAGVISGSGTLIKQGAGTLTLSGSNTFTRVAEINAGLVAIDSISASGQASPLGTSGTVNLGSGTLTGGISYTGTGHTFSRTINLAGTTGGGVIEANGSGALGISAAITGTGVGAKTLTLGGTSTAANSIGVIPDASGGAMSVNKTGPGLWRLTGNSSYTGRLTVLDGTVVVAANVGTNTNITGSSPFGSATGEAFLPVVGDTTAVSGTAALLLAPGVEVYRGFSVASGGPQVVVLGGTGSGYSLFGLTATLRIGRDVTLQAGTSGTVEFQGPWQNTAGGGSQPITFNVGSANNAGAVVFNSALPALTGGVNVRRGTLRLDYKDLTDGNGPISFGTPVTLGGNAAGGTLNLNGIPQPLGSLSFDGVGSSVIGSGTLVLFKSGSGAAVNVSGTGHVLSASTALDDPATFTVNAGGRLLVSGPIATGSGGDRSLTKTGPGTLELGAANTFSGPTIISQGTLALGAAGSFANSSTITVGDAGSSGAVLDLTGNSGGFTLGAGQTLEGGGTVKQLSSGTLTVAGLFSPGNSPGLFSYDGGTTLLSGTTLMEITGTARATSPSHGSGFYDAVNVSGGGLLSFGGTLELTFSSLFDTDTSFSLFSVLDSASLAGNFADVTVSGSFYNGLSWSKPTSNLWKSSETVGGQSLEFNASTGTLVIVVPEPSTLALLAVGGMAVVVGLRRLRTTKTFTASRSRAAGSCAARRGP